MLICDHYGLSRHLGGKKYGWVEGRQQANKKERTETETERGREERRQGRVEW